MQPKALLFDLDGTLLDSASIIATVLDSMRAEQGRDALQLATYKSWISLGAEQLVANALQLPATQVLDALAEFRRRYRLLPTPPASLFPGASATLAALHGAGWRLAVCSNKPEVLCRKALQELGLARYFGSVVGGDTAPFPKPHAAPLQHALAELQVAAPRALLVGDSTVDQQAAAAAGLPFIFFTGGYDDGVAAGTPRASIARLDQLPHLLTELLP